MNRRALNLALISAFIATYMIYSQVTSIEDSQRAKFGAEVLILTAKRDIAEMESINETMLEFRRIPKSFMDPLAISFEKKDDETEVDSQNLRRFTGMVAVIPIKKGEQISYTKITEPGLRTGLAPQVTKGKRAVAVPVNETTGVAKLVKPGDRVDLIGVINQGGGRENNIAKVLLQDILVLSVGKNVTNNISRTVEPELGGKGVRTRSLNESDSFNAVTLEVDPNQAQVLALVSSNPGNQIFLSLRNNDDQEKASTGSVGIRDLTNGDLRFPAQAQPNIGIGVGGQR